MRLPPEAQAKAQVEDVKERKGKSSARTTLILDKQVLYLFSDIFHPALFVPLLLIVNATVYEILFHLIACIL